MVAAKEEIPHLHHAIKKAFATSTHIANESIQRVKVDTISSIPMVCLFPFYYQHAHLLSTEDGGHTKATNRISKICLIVQIPA